LSPFHPNIHDHDFEWLVALYGHFTLCVHYYELPLTHYLLLIYCRLYITRDVASSAGSGVQKTVIRKAAEYLESAENLRIFSGRYIVGTLTNNANIIIHYYLVPYRLSTYSKTRDFE